MRIPNLLSQTELLLTEFHIPAKAIGNAESLIMIHWVFTDELEADDAQQTPTQCVVLKQDMLYSVMTLKWHVL